MVESGRVPRKGRIRASTEKFVWTSIGRGYNQCEDRKIVESGRVPGKGSIRESTEKLSGRVPGKGRISLSTLKW